MPLLALAALLIFAASSVGATDQQCSTQNGVARLTYSNFSDFTSSRPHVVVRFFFSNSRSDESTRDHFQAVAAQSDWANRNVSFAEVDCTTENMLQLRFAPDSFQHLLRVSKARGHRPGARVLTNSDSIFRVFRRNILDEKIELAVSGGPFRNHGFRSSLVSLCWKAVAAGKKGGILRISSHEEEVALAAQLSAPLVIARGGGAFDEKLSAFARSDDGQESHALFATVAAAGEGTEQGRLEILRSQDFLHGGGLIRTASSADVVQDPDALSNAFFRSRQFQHVEEMTPALFRKFSRGSRRPTIGEPLRLVLLITSGSAFATAKDAGAVHDFQEIARDMGLSRKFLFWWVDAEKTKSFFKMGGGSSTNAPRVRFMFEPLSPISKFDDESSAVASLNLTARSREEKRYPSGFFALENDAFEERRLREDILQLALADEREAAVDKKRFIAAARRAGNASSFALSVADAYLGDEKADTPFPEKRKIAEKVFGFFNASDLLRFPAAEAKNVDKPGASFEPFNGEAGEDRVFPPEPAWERLWSMLENPDEPDFGGFFRGKHLADTRCEEVQESIAGLLHLLDDPPFAPQLQGEGLEAWRTGINNIVAKAPRCNLLGCDELKSCQQIDLSPRNASLSIIEDREAFFKKHLKLLGEMTGPLLTRREKIVQKDPAKAMLRLSRHIDALENWVLGARKSLKTLYEAASGDGAVGSKKRSLPVDRVSVDDMSAARFRREYAEKGKPVVITGLSLTRKNWTLEHIASVCQNRSTDGAIKVKNRGEATWGRLVDAFPDASIGDFISGFKAGGKYQSGYLHDFSLPSGCPQLFGEPPFAEFIVPKFFATDLTQFNQGDDWYTNTWPSLFVGGNGTESALHVDSGKTNFWMALLSGRKHWRFYDWRQKLHLYEDIANSDFRVDVFSSNVSRVKYPLFEFATMWETYQEPGDLIFIPAGAPHAVRNLDDISALSANYIDESNFALALLDHYSSLHNIEDIDDIGRHVALFYHRGLDMIESGRTVTRLVGWPGKPGTVERSLSFGEFKSQIHLNSPSLDWEGFPKEAGDMFNF